MAYGYAATGTTALNRVLGLLGLAALVTAAGAFFGPLLGTVGFWAGIIGGFVTLLVLRAVRNTAPLNLILFVAFSALEGVVLGDVLEIYIASGLSVVVVQAAAATAAAALAAGTAGYLTKRDLTRLGGFLFIALMCVVVASVVGLFFQSSFLWTAISAVSAVLFSAFLVFDLNRIARAGTVSEGDAIVLAISVYLDVFNLFLDLLYLLGGRRSN